MAFAVLRLRALSTDRSPTPLSWRNVPSLSALFAESYSVIAFLRKATAVPREYAWTL
jgi:hypothetical protein